MTHYQAKPYKIYASWTLKERLKWLRDNADYPIIKEPASIELFFDVIASLEWQIKQGDEIRAKQVKELKSGLKKCSKAALSILEEFEKEEQL